MREDVDRELDAHVAMRAEELVAEGWEPGAARQEAERLFGARAPLVDECVEISSRHQRTVRRARTLDTILQDFRYGLRSLSSAPAFAAVAIVTLALGIGANTAIFSVVHAVLLAPLPFDQPGRLVEVREERNQGGYMSVAWANLVDWERQSASFEALAALGTESTTVLGGAEPVTAAGARVSAAFWTVFRIVPIEGRLTVREDHIEGVAAPSFVVTEGFWRTQLGAVPLDELRLEAANLRGRVVGVIPDATAFPAGTQIYYPAELTPRSESRTSHSWRAIGRLAPGTSVERAHQELGALTASLVATEAEVDPDFLAAGVGVFPLHERVVGSARAPLLLLSGAAALVLLVACTNLASTLLARGARRTRELAVRSALGAGRWRIVGQLLTECLVLALLGGAAGVALARALVALLQALAPEGVPRLGEVGLDATVLGYTAGITIVTVLLVGLLPSLRLARTDAADALRSGARGNAFGARASTWRLLVGTEVALALVLLVGSALLVRSFQTLLTQDVGFAPDDVVAAPVTLSRVKYEDPGDHVRFHQALQADLRSNAAVSAAGLISTLPMAGSLPNGRIELDGDLTRTTTADYVLADRGAFEVLDIPLLQGRLFDDGDRAESRLVAIVSASFARQVWPDESAIGRQVTGGGIDELWETRPFAEVVGVVGDVRYQSLADEPQPTVYFPPAQRPFRIGYGAAVVVEAGNGDPGSVAPLLRSAIRSHDADLPIRIASLASTVRGSLAARGFSMTLLTGFSLTALILAVVGIYGVVAYTVARRRREMGIRLALGASPGKVRRMVVRSSLGMVAGGLVVGMVATAALAGTIRSMLFGVSPTDPVAVLAAVVLLGGAALLASWLPARSGTRVDPMVTMRSE